MSPFTVFLIFVFNSSSSHLRRLSRDRPLCRLPAIPSFHVAVPWPEGAGGCVGTGRGDAVAIDIAVVVAGDHLLSEGVAHVLRFPR